MGSAPPASTAPKPGEFRDSHGDRNTRQHPTAPEHIKSLCTAWEGTAALCSPPTPNPTPWSSPGLPVPSSCAVLELRAEEVPGAGLAVGIAELGGGVGCPGEDGVSAVPGDHVWLGTEVSLDGADVVGPLDGAVVGRAEPGVTGRDGDPAGLEGGSAAAVLGVAGEGGVAVVCGGDREAAASLLVVVSCGNVCVSAAPELGEGSLRVDVVTPNDELGWGCGVVSWPWTVPKERAEQQGWGRVPGAAAPPQFILRVLLPLHRGHDAPPNPECSSQKGRRLRSRCSIWLSTAGDDESSAAVTLRPSPGDVPCHTALGRAAHTLVGSAGLCQRCSYRPVPICTTGGAAPALPRGHHADRARPGGGPTEGSPMAPHDREHHSTGAPLIPGMGRVGGRGHQPRTSGVQPHAPTEGSALDPPRCPGAPRTVTPRQSQPPPGPQPRQRPPGAARCPPPPVTCRQQGSTAQQQPRHAPPSPAVPPGAADAALCFGRRRRRLYLPRGGGTAAPPAGLGRRCSTGRGNSPPCPHLRASVSPRSVRAPRAQRDTGRGRGDMGIFWGPGDTGTWG